MTIESLTTCAVARLRSFCLAILIGLALPAAALPVNPIPGKNILVLFSYGEDVQAYSHIASSIKEKLLADGVNNDQIYFERLDLVRFRTEHKKELLALLNKKYARKPFAAIITVHRAALDFVLDDMREVFPEVPVAGMLLRPEVDKIESPRLLRLPYRVDYRGTLELALQLFPETQRVVLMTGDSQADRSLEREAFLAFQPWQGKLQFESTRDLSVPQMLEKFASLPPHSLIIASTVFADKAGAAYSPLEVTRDTVVRANSPVFGLFSTNMAVGVVGGHIVDFDREGKQAAVLALKMARGELRPGQLPVYQTQSFAVVDWRQLERWGVNTQRLPAGVEILHRPSSLWQTHRTTVIIVAVAMILLCGMVVALALATRRRRLAEIAARDNEKRLALATDASGVGVWELDLKGERMVWDETMFRIYQVRRQDFTGTLTTWERALHPDDREMAETALKAAIAGVKPYEIDFRICWPDGEVRYIKGSGQVIVDAEGRPERMLGTNWDVTDYHRVEAEIIAERDFNSLIIDSTPAYYVAIDRNGKVLKMNRSMLAALGYASEEVIGQDYLATFVPELEREGLAARFARLGEAGERTSDENLILARDGRQLLCEWHGVPVRKDGQVEYFIGMGIDITERRVLESTLYFITRRSAPGHRQAFIDDLLRFLCETLQVDHAYLGHLESEGQIRTIARLGDGQTLADLTYDLPGTPSAEIVGKELSLYPGGVRERFPEDRGLAELQAESYAGVPLWGSQNEAIGILSVAGRQSFANPERLRAVLQIVAVRAAQELEGMLSERLAREKQDELERVVAARTAQLELAVREISDARDAAEAATRAKSQFLANMSHEIRTPMNAILGMTDLALRSDPTAKQRDYLQKVKTAADSLLGIINDILDFSKIEAGKLEMEASAFELDDVLEQVTALVALRAHAKKIEFLLDTADNLPRKLIGDPLRLRQILVNLCNNAVKFTERGEIAIVTSLVAVDEGSVTLRFAVRDTGIGMDATQMARLFQPFSQADSSTTRKYGGTGLGLAICKQLVGLMGGKIGVDSQLGEGSEFYFTACFRLANGVNDRALESVPALSSLRVLVIDDSAHARQILAGLLRQVVAQVGAVTSAAEGLVELGRVHADAPYDLVLTDWQMPEMDGFGLAAAIRAEPQRYGRPRIMLVTGYGSEEVQQRANAERLDGYLVKPVSASALLDALVNVCGSRIARVAAPAVGEGEADIAAIHGLKVLLVEDNEFNQQVARELLEGVAGARVRIAGNGLQALECLRESLPDVVLMDIQMPVMDGYEATARIRAEAAWQDLPVIAMTAHAMRRDRDKCLQAGMNDYITKPFDPARLFAVLAQWVPRRAADSPAATSIPAPEARPAPVSLAGISFELGLKCSFGKTEILHRLLKMFVDTRGAAASEIRAALDSGDYKTAAMIAHSLKSGAGTIGAETLSVAARALEQAIDEQRQEEWDIRLLAFADELDIVIAGLQAYRNEHPERFA